jgi:deoxyribodipyrimidine photo-lyase
MQRDQRATENWALLYAKEKANERQVGLVVVFNLVPTFGDTTLRHYDFMFRGLKETEAVLNERNIPFVLLEGKPTDTIPTFVKTHGVGEVVTDFNPLRFTDDWRRRVGKQLPVRLTEVDAHNIVPCWQASDKEEFAAYTFRPKVTKLLPAYLTDFPPLRTHTHDSAVKPSHVDWEQLLVSRQTNRIVAPVDWLTPGTEAGKAMMRRFISERLATYDTDRNDPTKAGQSNASPYLHFGQLAPQWVAREVEEADAPKVAKEAYLEELIVRRELADNFCFYNQNYDRVEGAHEWAQKTIKAHAKDKREYLYSRKQLEQGETHDELWNAMQMQLVQEGKLHGWCRMYWAKKILEWTKDTQTAIDEALYLNDTYELDGTDPNGITGVMWSIAGVHDRAWTERPIFGKIRYMNFNGAKRKFDVATYIARYSITETLFTDD